MENSSGFQSGSQNPQPGAGLSPFSQLPKAQGTCQQEPQHQQQNMFGFVQYASLPASVPSAFLQVPKTQGTRQHEPKSQPHVLPGFAQYASLPASAPSAFLQAPKAQGNRQHDPKSQPHVLPSSGPSAYYYHREIVPLLYSGFAPPAQKNEYVNANDMVDNEDMKYNGEGSQDNPVDLTGGDDEYEGLQMIELDQHRRIVKGLKERIADLEAQLRAAKRTREASSETVGRSSEGPHEE